MSREQRPRRKYKEQRLPKCLRCNVHLKPIMQMQVRTGGSSGWFSEFGEYAERILGLDTFRCPRCRKLEFFDLDNSLPGK